MRDLKNIDYLCNRCNCFQVSPQSLGSACNACSLLDQSDCSPKHVMKEIF